jgi:hypothetical protein
LWGDTTGDTVTKASMKMDGTTFKDTSNVNLIVIDGTNVAAGWVTLGSVISRAANIALGYKAINILISGGANTTFNTSLSVLLTGSDNVYMGNTSRAAYILSEFNDIYISNINRTIGESKNSDPEFSTWDLKVQGSFCHSLFPYQFKKPPFLPCTGKKRYLGGKMHYFFIIQFIHQF